MKADKLYIALLLPTITSRLNKAYPLPFRLRFGHLGILYTLYYTGGSYGNYVSVTNIYTTGSNYFFRKSFNDLKKYVGQLVECGLIDEQQEQTNRHLIKRYSLTITGINAVNKMIDVADEFHRQALKKRKPVNIAL